MQPIPDQSPPEQLCTSAAPSVTVGILELPETERGWARSIAELETLIIEEAKYIGSAGVRHPANDIRASRRAMDLAKARKLILDFHPAITTMILDQVHQAMNDARDRCLRAPTIHGTH